MEAAFEKPFDQHRLVRRRAGAVSMGKKLTEVEFAQAVDESLPRLIAIARRLTGDEELARDAVQNALLKASKSWRRFQGRAHVETWLTRILIHCARDIVNEQRKRSARAVPLGSAVDDHVPSLLCASEIADPGRGPTERVTAAETEQLIRRAVQALPHRQREVFSLVIWQGMSTAEVADVLGLTAQNIHANLYAARRQLRSVLGHRLSTDQE